MNYLDIIILVPIVWFAIRGFMRGLILSIASLAGMVAGIYAAVLLQSQFATFLGNFLSFSNRYLSILAFILIFAAVITGFWVIGKLIEKMVDMAALGFANKFAGGIFGIIKALLITGVLLYLINILDRDQRLITPTAKEDSFMYKPVSSVVPFLKSVAGISDFHSGTKITQRHSE